MFINLDPSKYMTKLKKKKNLSKGNGLKGSDIEKHVKQKRFRYTCKKLVDH